ncbi:alb1 domain-containing protein [Cordyceps javanica]|uniref:Alb1 domain-containing protein n=1 Tax=Cordyceps javanica TaxID=43265 RepID=A0A545UQQ4_9HYPO|nr:alb1 domain-containing protein [Cordyceps javanica]TQW03741.1 alb1 domain-containing protein [Cordyceps javanica]
MAKAKSQPSKRSRAARRATSPSIDTDRSLKTAQPPPRGKPTERPSVLAVHHSAGVQKKTSQRKARVSAKARRRREKGMEMAEAVMERTSSKVQRSLHRQRAVDSRRKAWDAINKDVNGDDEQEEETEDEEMGVAAAAAAQNKAAKDRKGNKAGESKDEEGWETDDNEEAQPIEQAVADDGLDEIM